MHPTRSGSSCPIDAYIADLGAALPGPRQVRADLLAEARDGLADAAAAYAGAGYAEDEARRRAVADFGAVETVAPGYRRELAAAQGRRTVLWVLLTHLAAFAEGNLSWRVLDLWQGRRPGPLYLAVADVVDIAGYVIAVTLLAVLLGYPLLSRYVPVRPLVRAIGAYAFVVMGLIVVSSVALMLGTPVASSGAAAIALSVPAILLPALVTGLAVGRGAHRCLTLAV